MPVKIIAEIGINHNGDMDITKKLIDIAAIAGCDYVKFQKRNPEVCVPPHQASLIKKTPWGEMTYLEYKWKVEFNEDEYDVIDKYCKQKNIGWFASVWDQDSVDFMTKYSDITKIPSAHLTNHQLLSYARNKNRLLMLSTGMSTENQIEEAVEVGNPDIIFHTNSTYPSPINELNLKYINHLIQKYPDKIIGYSGHEFGLVPSFVASSLGAMYIERHITLDRTMWGSDQMASVEPGGLLKLVKGIRDIEKALGSSDERIISEGEREKMLSLRG